MGAARYVALLMLISGESVGVEGSAAGGLVVSTTPGVEGKGGCFVSRVVLGVVMCVWNWLW
jgi:hypothetical protein